MSKYNRAIPARNKIFFLMAMISGVVAACAQQPPACINGLIEKAVKENSANPCLGGTQLLGIDVYDYQGTTLFSLVFEHKNPCPDFANTTIFYDADCQPKIRITNGGIAFRHQVSPQGINEKDIRFKQKINWTNTVSKSGRQGQNGNLVVEPGGQALKSFYLGLNVENLWIAGNHVNWQTGEADKPDATAGVHTHCSAFVAAACKKLNLYILRPPEHKQELLANAQFDWLSSPQGVNAGWKKLEGSNIYQQAQTMANRGTVVVAICKNPDNSKPGHVALIMPGDITTEKLESEGPHLIMAGTHNFNKISLKSGFKSHLNGWPENIVQFYYNTNPVNYPATGQ